MLKGSSWRALRSVSVCAVMVLTFGSAAAAMPAANNDNFANAKAISPSALPYIDEVDASAATIEPAETTSACNSSGASIWYTIKPTHSGYLRADTFGSNGNGGAELTIYRGWSLASLTEVACGDKATEGTRNARVAFAARAGTTYRIRLTSVGSVSVLHLYGVTPPKNDAFSGAVKVTALPYTAQTSNVNATLEPSEPDAINIGHNCPTISPSLWYSVQLTKTQVVRAEVFGAIDTGVAIYRGTSLGSLVPIVCDDDISNEGTGYQSSIAWQAKAGTHYYVQVGGYNGETGDLRVRFTRGTPPGNDNFSHATTIAADGNLHRAITVAATIQTGEPRPVAGVCASSVDSYATVWYAFTAPDAISYDVDSFGSTFDTVLAVYTGSTLAGLTEQACNVSPTVSFTAAAGTLYYIQVGGNTGDSGELHVHLNPTAP